MNRFLVNVFLMAVLIGIVLECVIRYRHLTMEVPKRTITADNIQKYIPNQSGYWKGGKHTWQVNQLGWVGPMPESMHNLITIVGDSHIENLMNKDECRQSSFLKLQLRDFNFLEAARAGVSFIEALEICNSLDTLHPRFQLIYLKNSDFTESISNLGKIEDITQIDIDKRELIYGKLRSIKMKELLYSSKLLYFLYTEYKKRMSSLINDPTTRREETHKNAMLQIERLFKIVQSKYTVTNKVLIFHPGTDARILELAKQTEFSVLQLEPKIYRSWSWSEIDNSHWHCDGHKEGAAQVADYLRVHKELMLPTY